MLYVFLAALATCGCYSRFDSVGTPSREDFAPKYVELVPDEWLRLDDLPDMARIRFVEGFKPVFKDLRNPKMNEVLFETLVEELARIPVRAMTIEEVKIDNSRSMDEIAIVFYKGKYRHAGIIHYARSVAYNRWIVVYTDALVTP